MRKWIAALGACFLLSIGYYASAQQWVPGGTGTPIICGYNSSPPTATTGQYVLAQCDATGHLVTAASGGSGGSVTQGTVPWVVSNAGTFATQLTGATNNINNVAGTVSLPTGASTAALQSSVQGTAGTPAAAVISVQGVSGGTALPTTVTAYPTSAVPITASATGTTAATTATLTNVTGHTTYICGFSIRANATAAATNNATVTGTITGTLNFTQWTAPLASGLGVTEEVFSPCVSASAISTSIAVISGAPGSGGVVSVTAWGFSI